MNYKPILSERVLRQLGGFPLAALRALGETMSVVCEDPYDGLATWGTDDPLVRGADFGEYGFVTFLIIDSAMVVRVTDITWAG